MAKSMEIPQDIIDNVIAAVGDDKRLLKQCSLVSSSFLLPSRKQLFSSITLRSDRYCQRIHQFLVQNPAILSSVRAINLTEYIDSMDRERPLECQWMNSTSLLAILRLPFFCLECFSINVLQDYWGLKPWNWNTFNSEMNDALSNIIHSSNLKTLSLKGITGMPTTFFHHIFHLTTLELHSVSPEDFRYVNSSSLTHGASMGVAPTSPHPVIDRCIWHLKEYFEYRSEHASGTRFTSSAYLSLKSGHEGPDRSFFLPFICRLRFFEIDVDLGPLNSYDFDILSFLMGSLRLSLTSPATLEHLKFSISLQGEVGDVDCEMFYEYIRYIWTHLDPISTHPTGSRLQRVDINIDYRDLGGFLRYPLLLEPDEHEVLKAVLDGLPLLRSKDILFVEIYSIHSCARYESSITESTGFFGAVWKIVWYIRLRCYVVADPQPLNLVSCRL